MKRPFMVWIGFVVAQKLSRKAKVALACWYSKELLKTLKVAQKLSSTILIYLCLPETIRVSFSLFLSLSVFCYFTLLLIFIKIILSLLLFYLFIFMKIIFIFSCSGMFRNVPACSGMFHVPGFIDAPVNYLA